MSNNFPVFPSDLVLQSVTYTAGGTGISAVTSADGTYTANNKLADGVQMQIDFATAGAYGSFDQAAFEAGFKNVINAICQLSSALTGQSLATVQANVAIKRAWSFTDGSGAWGSYRDTLAYP